MTCTDLRKQPRGPRTAASNCPNCDGLLSYEGGLHCEYCGAWFEQPEDGDMVEFRDWAGDVVYRMSPSDWPSPPNVETR